MDTDFWDCPGCGAKNETWRRWCRSCPIVQPAATPSFGGNPGPATYAADPERVHPALVFLIVALIAVAGLVAYIVVRPSDNEKPPVAAQDASTGGPALDNQQLIDTLKWTADDAPKGWSSTTDTTEFSNAHQLSVPSCGVQGSNSRSVASGMGPVLSNGDYHALEVVELMPTTADVVADFNAISNGTLIDCIRGRVLETLGPLLCRCGGLTVTVLPMTVPPNSPSTTFAFRFTLDVQGNVVSQVDAYFIADGRTEITLLFLSTRGTFPTDAASRLTSSTLERMANTPTPDKTF